MLIDLLIDGLHDHAGLTDTNTGSGESALADVHHAHPTDTDRIETRVVAEDGDLEPRAPCRIEDRRSACDFDLVAVEGEPNAGVRHRRSHASSSRSFAASEGR